MVVEIWGGQSPGRGDLQLALIVLGGVGALASLALIGLSKTLGRLR